MKSRLFRCRARYLHAAVERRQCLPISDRRRAVTRAAADLRWPSFPRADCKKLRYSSFQRNCHEARLDPACNRVSTVCRADCRLPVAPDARRLVTLTNKADLYFPLARSAGRCWGCCVPFGLRGRSVRYDGADTIDRALPNSRFISEPPPAISSSRKQLNSVIARRNVASEPFSKSSRRAILSSVIVVILGQSCVLQPNPTQDRRGGR